MSEGQRVHRGTSVLKTDYITTVKMKEYHFSTIVKYQLSRAAMSDNIYIYI